MSRRYGTCYVKVESTFAENTPYLRGRPSGKKAKKAIAERSRKQKLADENRANVAAATGAKAVDDDATEWHVVKKPEVQPKQKPNKTKPKPKPKKSSHCRLRGHDHEFALCPNNPKSENYCGVHYREIRMKEVAEEGVNNKIKENEDNCGENTGDPIKSDVKLGEYDATKPAEISDSLVMGDATEGVSPAKKKKKKKKKNRGRKNRSGICRLKGHDHQFVDCPNNPKSENYCGVPYKVIREQERAEETEHQHSDAIVGEVNEFSNDQQKKESTTILESESGKAQHQDASNMSSPVSVIMKQEHIQKDQDGIEDISRNLNKESFALLETDSCKVPLETTDKASSLVKDVYVSPVAQSNMLKQHLSSLTVSKNNLPMDMSNFYEKYILSSDVELDVRRSTYHSLHSWLEAMQSEGLVVLEKTFQTGRKFRKRAASKSVVAVGREQVLKYTRKGMGKKTVISPNGISFEVPAGSNKEENETEESMPHMLEVNDQSTNEADEAIESGQSDPLPSSKDQTSDAKVEMDKKLKACILRLQVDQDELPMGIGNFYSKHIKSESLDVHKSSYRTLTRWMLAMEKEGHVLLKKQSRSKSAPLVVVAVGNERVMIVKRKQKGIESNVPTINEAMGDSDMESFSSSDDSDYDHIDLKRTIHSRRIQHSRNITDIDLKRTIEKAKKPIKRGKDGVRTISADGVTVVVACGQKNKVITAWKEGRDSDYRSRWTQKKSVALNAEYEVRGQQQIVTISETYERHQKPGRRGKKGQHPWAQGDLVTKNKKHRKNFIVVGLDDSIILAVKKQLQNQMGCHVSVGTLSMESWVSIHGEENSPLAKEGSRVIMFNLAADNEMISRALEIVEKHVPAECRRT